MMGIVMGSSYAPNLGSIAGTGCFGSLKCAIVSYI